MLLPLTIHFCHFLIQSSENLYTRKERRGPHDAQTHAGPFWAVENHLRDGALPPIMLTSPYPSSFRTSDHSSPDNSLLLPKSAAVPILTTRVRTCIRYKTQSITLKMFSLFVFFLFYICFQTISNNYCKQSVFKDASIIAKIKQLYILQTVSFSLSAEGNGTTVRWFQGLCVQAFIRVAWPVCMPWQSAPLKTEAL